MESFKLCRGFDRKEKGNKESSIKVDGRGGRDGLILME
jgi:hypothetical protein